MKGNTELVLDARPSADFSQSEFQLLTSKILKKKKIMPGQQKVTQIPLVTNKVVSVRERHKPETETRGCGKKEVYHHVDQYHQLIEDSSVEWITRGSNSGAVSSLVNAAVWKSMLG